MEDLRKFDRMMVALDLTPMDEHILKYASMVVKNFDITKVYFIHITTSFELPEEMQDKYGDLMAPIDETLESGLHESISQYFTAQDKCEMQINAYTGKVTEEILKLSKIKMIDLTLLGRKSKLNGSGLNSKKVAKSTPSSVIFVTENPQLKLNKILISIDYSEHSKMAFEIGMDLQNKTGAKIYSNHVYRVPSGYHKTGKTYDEFAEIMLENTKKDCQKFFRSMNVENVDYENTYALDDDPHPADKIYKTGMEVNADIILLGSKGRSGFAAILIGSVAEKLVTEGNEIPIFLIKKDKENYSFIEALLNI